MTTVALEGVGASIAFSVSSFTGDLVSLTLPDESIEALGTTHLGTTGVKTSVPAKLAELGDIECEYDHVPNASRLKGVVQTFTISWPLRTGQVTAYKRVYTGFVTKQGGEEMKDGTLMRTKITIHPSADYTETAAT